MRFLTIYKTDAAGTSRNESGDPPTQREMEEMGQFIEELSMAGKLLTTEGCRPSSEGARVRFADGKATVTDGPFTEVKELVGGFAILQADSKEEAIELSRRFLTVAGDGECEIRLLHEAPALAPR